MSDDWRTISVSFGKAKTRYHGWYAGLHLQEDEIPVVGEMYKLDYEGKTYKVKYHGLVGMFSIPFRSQYPCLNTIRSVVTNKWWWVHVWYISMGRIPFKLPQSRIIGYVDPKLSDHIPIPQVCLRHLSVKMLFSWLSKKCLHLSVKIELFRDA